MSETRSILKSLADSMST